MEKMLQDLQQKLQRANFDASKVQHQNKNYEQIENKSIDADIPQRQPRTAWSVLEQTQFLTGISKYGTNAKQIANHIQTRTPIQCQSHIQKHLQRIDLLKEKAVQFTGQCQNKTVDAFLKRMTTMSHFQQLNLEIISSCTKYPGQFTNPITTHLETPGQISVNTLNSCMRIVRGTFQCALDYEGNDQTALAALRGELATDAPQLIRVCCDTQQGNLVRNNTFNAVKLSYLCESYMVMWIVLHAQGGIADPITKIVKLMKYLDRVLEHEYFFQNVADWLQMTTADVQMMWFCAVVLKAAYTYGNEQ
ncbi:Myb-like_DNA-binding domain-containing protein [Hexamita inflata]|uniref:Myb-like DNA-binding domain-containing protein n=1 Tax=Hexamita inflata TaxID=28002 RepID=A0AA86R7T2_9EUKA|nr:Myb-like DNA-binding domain-containing protein [Hexamita inflata]CAI9946539.1 Myb-like DNA-binding domain-containing protein [Hexamita inflata]CAI9973274.1 Myb-like DNA-binding domain-containing protein [Hexamita inflata]CAI9973279.1 Myb-like DNA-binding domain-containing protein [Hexamita inflata]CAI9973284.1 Myb-like DNA-binding domain-containing protein [Hexamita inflata]